jgi:hypothetical protein
MFGPCWSHTGGSRRITYCRRVGSFCISLGQQKPRRSWTALSQGGLRQTFICTLSKLTYSAVFVQCSALGQLTGTRFAHAVYLAAGMAWTIYFNTAIELGVFPVPYVMRGFKLPLLTPNA